MVESLGYRIRRLFVGVFAAGSALAGLGGVMWGLYQQSVTPQIGAQVNVLIFIVIIIGGLGSTLGCFIGALLVGLMANYTGLSGAEGGAVLQHRPDGADPAVAAAGFVSRHQPLKTMFIKRILSHDLPRSRWLALALLLIVLGLAFAPFLFPGSKALSVAAKMLVFILLVASYDLLLGYTGIVSFAHTMFFGIGAYGVAVASTRMGPGFRCGACRVGGRSADFAAAVVADRPVQPAREGHLLRHDHAGGGRGLPDAGLAAQRHHRRRRRPELQEPARAEPGVRALREPGLRPAARRQGVQLLPAVRGGGAALPAVAAHRQLTLRARAAGHPRERLPGRGHRLPHSGLSHAEQRAVGTVRHGRRCLAGAVAALYGPGHHARPSRSCSTSCSSSSSAAWARCTARSSARCCSCWRRTICRIC